MSRVFISEEFKGFQAACQIAEIFAQEHPEFDSPHEIKHALADSAAHHPRNDQLSLMKGRYEIEYAPERNKIVSGYRSLGPRTPFDRMRIAWAPVEDFEEGDMNIFHDEIMKLKYGMGLNESEIIEIVNAGMMDL